MSSAVGVMHDPWATRRPAPGARTPGALYRRGVEYKANPRDPDYLETMFRDRYPEGRIVRWRSGAPFPEAERVVLLYPDAIGLGWTAVERWAERGQAGEVWALNGRRRQFRLDRRTRRALRLRRVLEAGLVLELLAIPVVVAGGAVLAVADLMRGRR